MRLVVGVDKVLDLGLRELAHAQQPRARRDLVAVAAADLRRREGQLAAVVVEQVAEVDKDALWSCGGWWVLLLLLLLLLCGLCVCVRGVVCVCVCGLFWGRKQGG